MFVKDPHTALFSGPTSCGKTQRVLDLIETEYRHHFDNVVVLCSTLRWNSTYLEWDWIWKDDYVFSIEPRSPSGSARADKLFDWIQQLSEILSSEETLFIVDDMIADETLDKKRTALLDLAISGRHRKHSLWLLTQSYTAIPKNLRRQKKQLFLWSERSDLRLIDEETNLIPKDQLEVVKDQLKRGKHACLYVRLEHPRSFQVLRCNKWRQLRKKSIQVELHLAKNLSSGTVKTR